MTEDISVSVRSRRRGESTPSAVLVWGRSPAVPRPIRWETLTLRLRMRTGNTRSDTQCTWSSWSMNTWSRSCMTSRWTSTQRKSSSMVFLWWVVTVRRGVCVCVCVCVHARSCVRACVCEMKKHIKVCRWLKKNFGANLFFKQWAHRQYKRLEEWNLIYKAHGRNPHAAEKIKI